MVNAKAGDPVSRRPKSGAEKQAASQSSHGGSREHIPLFLTPVVREVQKGKFQTDSR